MGCVSPIEKVKEIGKKKESKREENNEARLLCSYHGKLPPTQLPHPPHPCISWTVEGASPGRCWKARQEHREHASLDCGAVSLVPETLSRTEAEPRGHLSICPRALDQ